MASRPFFRFHPFQTPTTRPTRTRRGCLDCRGRLTRANEDAPTSTFAWSRGACSRTTGNREGMSPSRPHGSSGSGIRPSGRSSRVPGAALGAASFSVVRSHPPSPGSSAARADSPAAGNTGVWPTGPCPHQRSPEARKQARSMSGVPRLDVVGNIVEGDSAFVGDVRQRASEAWSSHGNPGTLPKTTGSKLSTSQICIRTGASSARPRQASRTTPR